MVADVSQMCPRCGSDVELMWLWRRLAGEAPNGPLAWELPYVVGAALKRENKKQTKKSLGVPVVTQGLANPTSIHP